MPRSSSGTTSTRCKRLKAGTVPSLILGLGSIVLFGCTPLEGRQHPFQNVPAPAVADIAASPSVMVAPVGGPPPEVGRVLAELVADSLRERDVIAVTRNPAPGSLLLTGHAEVVPQGRDQALLKVAWSLTQADGLTTGTFTSEQVIPVIPGEDPYKRLSASAFVPFAGRVAFKVADQIQNPPRPVQVAAAESTAVEPSPAAKPSEPGVADVTEASKPDAEVPKIGRQRAATPKQAMLAPPSPAQQKLAAQVRGQAEASSQEGSPDRASGPASTERPTPASTPADSRAGEAAAKAPLHSAVPDHSEPPAVASAAAPVKLSQAEPPSNAAHASPGTKPSALQALNSPPPEASNPALLQQAALNAAMSRSEARKAATRPQSQPARETPESASPSTLIGTGEALAQSGPSGAVQKPPPTAQPSISATPTVDTKAPSPTETASVSNLPGNSSGNTVAQAPQPLATAAPAQATAAPAQATAAPAPEPVRLAQASNSAGGHLVPPAGIPDPQPVPAKSSPPSSTPEVGTPARPPAEVAETEPALPSHARGTPPAQPVAPQPAPPAHTLSPSAATASARSQAGELGVAPKLSGPLPDPAPPTKKPSPIETAVPAPQPAPASPAASAPAPNPASPVRVGTVNSVLIAPVQGSPGNGNQALTAAMRQALGDSGLQVADYAGPSSVVLHGRVTASPAGPNADNITIEWSLYDASGHFLGTVTQRNQLPRSLSQGHWDSTAPLAAQGAVEGIRSLVNPGR